MIKKLRIRLVLAAMFSLFIVLFTILTIISVFNYHSIVSTADSTLSLLVENDGSFPDSIFRGGKIFNDRLFSAELPYQSRYFSVFFDSNLDIISVDTNQIAAIGASEAKEYAEEVAQKGNDSGFYGNYRYVVYTVDSEIHTIFLDCTKDLEDFRTFLLTGIGVAAAGITVVFLLLIALSKRIVKPFSQNYEKQKQFITNAGHELKTPLTIIEANSELLEMDYGENEWVTDIQKQTKRLADLTNDLILLSRAQEGQPQNSMIEFPLSEIIKDTADTFNAPFKAQNKMFTYDIQPMVTMNGDSKSIQQLVTILLDNALKYSNPGGEIHLSLEVQKKNACLVVFNTADNVSKESVSHLFDRFYRGDPSRNSNTEGYGLGLSIAQAIVSQHKGKISAATQDEKSLLITITLPILA